MFYKISLRIILFLVISIQTIPLLAQMSGSETLVNKQIYKGIFVVNGDLNT